jgi:hypothetical protein
LPTRRDRQCLVCASAACNQRGELRLEGIDTGSYRLGIFSRGRALLHEEQIELTSDRYIEIALPANRLSGRVVNAEDFSPVPWADVILKTAWYGAGSYEAARTQTNAEGVFYLAERRRGALYRRG